MAAETNIACWVRVPASKQVTALHLTAEQEATGLCCCHKQGCSATFMTVELHPECCVCVTALTKEFAECRVAVNHALVAGLETACFVRIKVKRGRRTVRKKALDARFLIKCLQEERLVEGKVKLAFDITSFSPLTFCFHIKTFVSECSMTECQPVNVNPVTARTALPSAEGSLTDGQSATTTPVTTCRALPSAECPVTTECKPVPAAPVTVCTALPSAECLVTTVCQPVPAGPVTAFTELPLAEEDCRDAQETVEEQTCAPPTPNTDTLVLRNITIPRRYRHRIKGRGGVVGRLREDHPVTIEYNERCGVMKLRGLTDDVRRWQDNIDSTIKTWQRENSKKQMKKAAANGAKSEGKETTPRQGTKPVRAPNTRQDQAREQSKVETKSVCAPNTWQGTDRVCAPNTRQGTDRVCTPNTRQGTDRVCTPNTQRTATAIRNAPSPQGTRSEARQRPPAADGAPKERQRRVTKGAIKGRSKGVAKGPSKEALKGASHDTPEGAPRETQPWTLLPTPCLRSPDRRDILGQRWLSDDVMDLAQELLQRQFPNTRGLYASGAAFTLPPLQPGSGALFLQVVNRSTPMSLASMADYGRAGGSHWLVLSSYGAGSPGQLAVYDSIYDTLSASTAALVRQLQELHAPSPGAVMRPVQRQRDGYSCGLFALAFAFSIAHGQDPCRVRYVQARMARHLLACLERGTVTPFPSDPKDTMG